MHVYKSRSTIEVILIRQKDMSSIHKLKYTCNTSLYVGSHLMKMQAERSNNIEIRKA